MIHSHDNLTPCDSHTTQVHTQHTPHTSTCTCMQGTHHTYQHVHVCKAHTTHINMYMYARHTPHTSTCTCMQGTHHTHQHVHVCKAHTTHINMYMYARHTPHTSTCTCMQGTHHTHQHVHVCKAHTTHINMYMYARHTPHTSTCTCMQGTQTHKHTNPDRLFLACAIFPLIFPLHPITHILATEDLCLSLHLFQTHSTVPTKSCNFTKHIGPHDALQQLPTLMLMAVTKAMLRCSVHTLGAGLRKNGSMNISPG